MINTTHLFFDLVPTGIMQGLALAIIALGVMIPFRLLNFPDLTSEGSYPLGGAMCASLLVMGVNPILATILASVAGGVMGLGTAFVHLRFKVNTLLAGIILSTMIYSVNLRLMGKPNLSLFEIHTLFSQLQHSLSLKIIILILLNVAILGILYRYLLSEKGLRCRAVGLNPFFAEKQGISLSRYIFLGLFAGNLLNAFAGSLWVQLQQYSDINMGVGIVIHALAAMMIGESIIGTHTLRRQLFAPFIGALLYQQIYGLALSLGLAPTDLKLMTGAIVLLAISYRHFSLQETVK